MHSMVGKLTWLGLAAGALILMTACDEPEPAGLPGPSAAQAPEDLDLRWLPQNEEERFQALESQMGGFSQSMIEVGHRYNDLHFAMVDRNWDYADYQLEKIGDAIERGVQRRPDRGDSAQEFLDDAVPALQAVIDERNEEGIEQAMQDFTVACMTCHIQEDVPFMVVVPPEVRLSPVVGPGYAPDSE